MVKSHLQFNALNAWLSADIHGEKEVKNFYERRFLPEFKLAFDAWIKLDPINNSSAPPEPRYATIS
jgi:hypothetical protein